MKNNIQLLGTMLLACALVFLACDKENDDNSSLLLLLLGAGGHSTGDTETYTAGSVSFIMAYVPGGKTFPTGTDDDGTATVAKAYWIGETEVTYELWEKVYAWATGGTGGATGEGQYTFANPGIMGDGTGDTNKHPVTTVNWLDSMVWCNALTEWYNAQKGTRYKCVYTYSSAIIRDSRDSNATACNGAVASSKAKGFRLLTSNEYELAARWSDDATNTVSGYIDPYFTKGDSASGATTYYNDNTGGSGEPGKSANDAVAVNGYYWNGSGFISTGVSSTAPVKSKGLDGANALGLYDMSGNVFEWCFDLDVSKRVQRGGSWLDGAGELRVGYWYSRDPSNEYYSIGFRFARTQ